MSAVRKSMVACSGILAVVLLLMLAQWVGASPPLPKDGGEGESVPASGGIPVEGDLFFGDAAPGTVGNCSAATAVTCNSVFSWTNNLGNQWSTYNCLDTGIFSSTPYQEALFTLVVTTTGLDIGLGVAKHTRDMDLFDAILGSCNNENCRAGGHNVDHSVLSEPIVTDAVVASYNMVIDSPNMNGFGDAILSCGEHDSGWCWDADVVSTSVPCGVGTLTWSTDGGSDKIIDYGTRWAMDGPEVVAELVVTSPSFLGMRLSAGDGPSPHYYEYLQFFVLDDACNQRDWEFSSWFARENSYSDGSGNLAPGDYYIVVDGLHVPTGGLDFHLEIACLANHVYLPVTLMDK